MISWDTNDPGGGRNAALLIDFLGKYTLKIVLKVKSYAEGQKSFALKA
jgi:hypothetical protein